MRGKLFLLSFISAILLSAAWPTWGFAPLLFVAFVPLLMVQHTIQTDSRLRARHLFVYAYFTFLLWNLATTWWVKNASAGGAAMAILCNALLMALVFLVYHKIRLILPQRFSAFTFPAIWIAFEFLHLDWDLTWPWLTLGNAFAENHQLIQWYEYTGIFGGSLWALLLNILVFELITYRHTTLRPLKKKLVYFSAIGILIVVPMTVSLVMYFQVPAAAASNSRIDVVVVQPNIDPYKEKFNSDFRVQLKKMFDLALSKTDSSTDYLVFPETALVEDIWENNIENTYSLHELRALQARFPKLVIVTGASTYRAYREGEPLSGTARKFSQGEGYYDAYNTALQIDSDKTSLPVYHKSKLVPGVEKMPFPAIFKPLEKLAIDLGGTSGSLGMQEERTAFFAPGRKTAIAPVICYESIYGEYVGEYLRNGANFIFIITNDGWWGNTPGYRQHLLYGRLRAIETRKGIARSANTGISCFIDARGDISQPTGWWQPAVIRGTVESIPGETFYTRHGDYLGRIALWASAASLLLALLRRIRAKVKKA